MQISVPFAVLDLELALQLLRFIFCSRVGISIITVTLVRHAAHSYKLGTLGYQTPDLID